MKRVSRVLVIALCVAAMSAGMSACNTFKGIGKDIKRGGEAIENAAERNQK